jgi:hypothetical protein
MDNFVHAKKGEQKANAVGVHVLRDALTNGGLQVLDIRARLDAIRLMRLKAYMRQGDKQPLWALIADGLLRKAAVNDFQQIEDRYLVNPWLQEWRVNINSRYLHLNLRGMVWSAEKYRAQCIPILPTKQTKKLMPFWYHLGTKARATHRYNNQWGKCQRACHAITTTGEMLEHANKNRHIYHQNRWNCDCMHCYNDTLLGCEDPIACRRNADHKLDMLLPKWDPHQHIATYDPEGLCQPPGEDPEADPSWHPIKWSPGDDDPLYHVRVFVEFSRREKECLRTQTSTMRERSPWEVEEAKAYTNGSCTKKRHCKCCSWCRGMVWR